MNARAAKRLAWSAWTVGSVLAIFAVVFLVLGRSSPPPVGTFGFRGFALLFFVTFGTVGALIASRHPSNPIGWIFLAMGVASAFQEFTAQYSIYAILANPTGRLPFATFAAWFPSWIWVPITSGAAYLLLLFPEGRLPSPRWRIVVWIELVGTAVATLGLALLPGPLENFRALANRFGVGDRAFMRNVGGVGQLVYGVGIILAAVALVGRFRRAHGEERQQLKWLAAAGLFLGVSLFSSFVTLSASNADQASFPQALLVIIGFSSVPIATGIAILRFRLFDIDVVINRAVVYGLLALFITAIYVGFVVGIGAAVGSRGNVVLSGLAAAVVAVAFQPARRAAQRLANRLVYGERATPYEVLAGFSERLAGAYSIDDVLPRIVRVLGEGTGSDRVSIWLHEGGELSRVATWPASAEVARVRLVEDELPALPGGERAFPVRHQGELLGSITVATPPSETLTPAQEKLFADVAAQAGLVVRNVQLVSDLRASRQRLVAAQDEERRRLERNLHDGAQQQLVALQIKQRLAEQMAEGDPASAKALLAELQGDTAGALENLRDLARGIYPPLLADKGLAAALEAQARKAPIPVTIEADSIGRLSQAVEATVYFCTLEALTNVAKYSGASSACVRVSNGSDELRFEVVDDGIGFDPALTTYGTGLQGMADRLAALGGELEVRSSPGDGTTVAGRLPTGGGG